MLANINIYILSINNISFNIPLYRYIVDFFDSISGNHVQIVHSQIKVVKDFTEIVKSREILTFSDNLAFNNQKLRLKIVKHFKIQFSLLNIFFKKGIQILYTPDFEVITSILIYKIILRKHNVISIYHQFELIEDDKLSPLKKYIVKFFYRIAKHIDLVLIPELNRLNYFQSNTGINSDSLLLFPNTCNTSVNKKELPTTIELETNHNIIAHIGTLSSKNFFLKEYLDCISKADIKNILLLFVGRITDEAKDLINSYTTVNTKIIDFIQHSELLKLYNKIDIGVILYKGVSLNLELAAPNKLYEYWSYGIPVIVPKLKGLVSLFKEDFLGDIVDFTDSKQLAGSTNRLLSDSSLIKPQIQYYFEKNLSIENYLEMFKKKIEKKVNLIQNV